MKIHDDTFQWEGWGGTMQLASGKCRLRIFDLSRRESNATVLMKPIVAVFSDLPREKISDLTIRSCSGHIATQVRAHFGLDAQRTQWVEYYPESRYGGRKEHTIPERFDTVDFTWREGRALDPRWKPAPPPLLATLKELLHGRPESD